MINGEKTGFADGSLKKEALRVDGCPTVVEKSKRPLSGLVDGSYVKASFEAEISPTVIEKTKESPTRLPSDAPLKKEPR